MVKTSKTNKAGQGLSKRAKKLQGLFDRSVAYSTKESIEILKKYAAECPVKFDETVDVVFGLGIDPRQTDQIVRGAIPMPNGLGKKIRVAVFVRPEKVEEAKKAGADIVGSEDLVEEVKGGRLDFDVCIASPDMMGKVGTLGKVLGPKGMMPNPKLGTVSNDVPAAIKQVKAGQVEFKPDKAGLVHAGVGKLSFPEQALVENILALYGAVMNAKPSASKGTYMRKAYISTTMGPAIMLDLNRIFE